jgi:Raf kinase inhibitor-like YbhB/YbcL family protein
MPGGSGNPDAAGAVLDDGQIAKFSRSGPSTAYGQLVSLRVPVYPCAAPAGVAAEQGNAMSIKSRALAIGGSALLALSLIIAVALVATATPSHPASESGAAAKTAALKTAALKTAASKTAAVKTKRAREDSTTFAPFTITSPDFTQDGWLPVSSEGGPASATGCSGRNLAPTLNWYNTPSGTQSFAFTITDVDAPVAGWFHHWIVYNIPAGVTTLKGHGSNPYSEGTNDYGFVGYGGPCPPADGQVHHYIFTVYALSTASIPGKALTYNQLMSEISPYVIGVTSTIGKFVLPRGA